MYKKIFIILIAGFVLAQYTGTSFGAGSDSSSDSYVDFYSDAKKFVLRAKKLEEKNKIDRATKLYSKALEKLEQAYKTDRNNKTASSVQVRQPLYSSSVKLWEKYNKELGPLIDNLKV